MGNKQSPNPQNQENPLLTSDPRGVPAQLFENDMGAKENRNPRNFGLLDWAPGEYPKKENRAVESTGDNNKASCLEDAEALTIKKGELVLTLGFGRQPLDESEGEMAHLYSDEQLASKYIVKEPPNSAKDLSKKSARKLLPERYFRASSERREFFPFKHIENDDLSHQLISLDSITVKNTPNKINSRITIPKRELYILHEIPRLDLKKVVLERSKSPKIVMNSYSAAALQTIEKLPQEIISIFSERLSLSKVVYACNDGSTYRGDIDQHQRKTGIGEEVTPEGGVYRGEWKNNVRYGKGLCVLPEGSYFFGDYVNGLATGKGVFHSSQGVIYEGDFDNSSMCGKGKLIFPDGALYVGHFLNGLWERQGELILPSGTHIRGEFTAGILNGFCRLQANQQRHNRVFIWRGI